MVISVNAGVGSLEVVGGAVFGLLERLRVSDTDCSYCSDVHLYERTPSILR